MLTPAQRFAAFLAAFFAAIVAFVRRLLGIAGEAGTLLANDARAIWRGVTAANEGVGRGLDLAVAKPGMALARVLGGAALATAGGVGSALGALLPLRPASAADLARHALAADSAPMPSTRSLVRTSPRFGDGREVPYLLTGNALGVAVQDIARARAMGDSSVGAKHPDVPADVLRWVFELTHPQLALLSRLPAAAVHQHITGKGTAAGLPPAPPPARVTAELPLYSPSEVMEMARKAKASLRRETVDATRFGEELGRRRIVSDPDASGPAFAL
ncbi:hypothetical protein [Methylobacterium indicum]|uniref:hypothetical protein n=1 Tax=Methylobacterium indicum TaxID=1775910 RepID=UPI0024349ECE|nr:hypothetical protein [Methylobacterium indicum]